MCSAMYCECLNPVTYFCRGSLHIYMYKHCWSFDVYFKTLYETQKEIAWNRFKRKKSNGLTEYHLSGKSSVLVHGQDRASPPPPSLYQRRLCIFPQCRFVMHGKLHIRHKSQKNFEALDDFLKNDITRLFKYS